MTRQGYPRSLVKLSWEVSCSSSFPSYLCVSLSWLEAWITSCSALLLADASRLQVVLPCLRGSVGGVKEVPGSGFRWRRKL